MKLMFVSDIHGSAFYCKKMLERYEKLKADRLILLGDLLYHGPRNDLPKEYVPKEVIKMLNERKNEIYAVRGNCEAEVDQMVLEFPIMAEYVVIVIDNITFFATHGHIFHREKLPPMKKGDVLVHGHTHVLKAEKMEDKYLFNPGSISIPKEGNPPTYGLYENGEITIWDLEGNCIKKLQIKENGEEKE
ncbi:MAG: phosphodiesterase [Lachnospiraceae bacterium]|jgi:putative phosphoesterase|nr:phosphodiesterase [Lachnospiraceae bacterium]